MKTVITVVIVLAVIIFGYLIWRYYNCKKTEGQACMAAGGRVANGREASGKPLDLFFLEKKIKCNFWKGKTCS